jgi:hypothetical protein
MLESKLNSLVEEVCGFYREKVETLLSICESPIEKVYMMDFIKFYAKNSLRTYTISFSYDHNVFDTYGQLLENHPPEDIHIPGFRDNNPIYLYGLKISHNDLNLNFEIIPQYIVKVDGGKTFRVDFAIIGKGHSKKHIEKETDFKIFIECDGYEYHRTPAQINKDNVRANYLKSNGWMEFRYSGKNINDEGFSAAKDVQSFIYNYIKPHDGMWDERATFAP